MPVAQAIKMINACARAVARIKHDVKHAGIRRNIQEQAHEFGIIGNDCRSALRRQRQIDDNPLHPLRLQLI